MVSVIILTHNSKPFLAACLASLYCQDCRDFEVIVVDNGSNDGTVAFLKSEYPQARTIENNVNLGAAKARNQAIAICKGEWILALDCDVVLEKDFLVRLTEEIKNASETTGMLQPKILYPDKSTIYSFGIYVTWLKKFYDIGKGSLDHGQFDRATKIHGACCAAACYRRTMLDAIRQTTGFFDERFFFLVEDVDVALRAQPRWQALFCPALRCYHHGNSSGFEPSKRQYLCWRNRKLMLRKVHIPLVQAALVGFWYDFPKDCWIFCTNAYAHNDMQKKRRPQKGQCSQRSMGL